MKITTKIGWTAFLVTLATFNLSSSEASVLPPTNQPSNSTLESRLARIVSILKTKESQLPQKNNLLNPELAGGFANRSGGGGFANRSGGGGFVNLGGGGGFANASPWRNGWSDGGGFLNRR
ncbi:MAG: GrrA/OscA1 family cyclophane-containing rSAM-modified RiPP [Microcystaceae cyanobacterium]